MKDRLLSVFRVAHIVTLVGKQLSDQGFGRLAGKLIDECHTPTGYTCTHHSRRDTERMSDTFFHSEGGRLSSILGEPLDRFPHVNDTRVILK